MTQERAASSFAILGQLALREWSAYELTRSMRRTLRFFWPRAESVIYAEARRLEAAGLASTRTEPAADGSRRGRTVYAITAAGRTALAQWLATPPAPPTWVSEPLLRVHLARFGDKAALLAAIDAMETAMTELLDVADTVATEFVEGRHLFQDEAHLRAVLFDGLTAYAEAMTAWARDARTEVARWSSVTADADARDRGVERMRQWLARRASGTGDVRS